MSERLHLSHQRRHVIANEINRRRVEIPHAGVGYRRLKNVCVRFDDDKLFVGHLLSRFARQCVGT